MNNEMSITSQWRLCWLLQMWDLGPLETPPQTLLYTSQKGDLKHPGLILYIAAILSVVAAGDDCDCSG